MAIPLLQWLVSIHFLYFLRETFGEFNLTCWLFVFLSVVFMSFANSLSWLIIVSTDVQIPLLRELSGGWPLQSGEETFFYVECGIGCLIRSYVKPREQTDMKIFWCIIHCASAANPVCQFCQFYYCVNSCIASGIDCTDKVLRSILWRTSTFLAILQYEFTPCALSSS